LLKKHDPSNEQQFVPIATAADGNCLLHAASIYLCGDPDLLMNELRVRLVMEHTMNFFYYLQLPKAHLYGKLSDYHKNYNEDPTMIQLEEFYKSEVLDVAKNSTYCGGWQLHALASILKADVCSVYPVSNYIQDVLNDVMEPRVKFQSFQPPPCRLMWTTIDKDATKKDSYDPNHFVLLLNKNT